jgi:hypothetical protein
MRKGITYTVAALIVAGLIVHAASKDQAPAAAKPKGPPLFVIAADMFIVYHKNEVAADHIFKGKPLTVVGFVQNVRADLSSRPLVGLKTDNEFMPVVARGIADDVAGKLRPDEHIKLSCTGAGMVLGSPQLDDCTIIERG